MVANASLDNEKSALTYQVELLKDQLEECEEQSALVSKELREKSRDYELLKRSHQETQRAVQLLQVTLFSTLGQKPTFHPEIPLILIFQKCEFCEKSDFRNVNFVKIVILEM